ncbi:MAG TPA: hypothetical protein VFX28_08945, partial [Methylomirabilota bacterium]|nr:hypothetical protein [Methylomirabilota bacterium]
WGRLAFALSGVATTLWLGLVALEITLGRAAPRAGDASALLLLRGLVETLISTAIVVNWLSTALLGAGLGASGRYPGWLSGSGVALGVLIVLAVGVPRAALGPTPLVDAALFPGLATLSLVWLVALGLRLWRG